jgi:flagellar protein FlgJ
VTTNSATLAPAPDQGRRDAPEQVREAAEQFEALLLEQMLVTMRRAGSSGWLGTGEDESGQSMMELAEQQFAHVLAERGGLGLARLVMDGLQSAKAKPLT